MTIIANNIKSINKRIQQVAESNQRALNSIHLMAVSKTRSADDITQAYHAGISHFGENYVQEAKEKINQLSNLPLYWHFIGALQANKTEFIAENFDWVHSIDRIKIVRRLSEQRSDSKTNLNICIQVNIDNEASKAGIVIEDIAGFIQQIATLPKISIRGLMVIPNPNQSASALQSSFKRTKEALQTLQKTFPALPLDTLSMGMSKDFELAITEGSTFLRIGSDIFGSRKKSV